MSTDPNCIFCKIVAGRIAAKKAYEDAELLAFHDLALTMKDPKATPSWRSSPRAARACRPAG